MTKLRPALGLIVLYRSDSEEGTGEDDEGVHVAIVTKVHNDRRVNLVVFPDGKPMFYKQSVERGEIEGQVDRWFSPELD